MIRSVLLPHALQFLQVVNATARHSAAAPGGGKHASELLDWIDLLLDQLRRPEDLTIEFVRAASDTTRLDSTLEPHWLQLSKATRRALEAEQGS